MNASTNDNGRVVRELLAAQVRGELAAARATIAPDVVYHLHAYQRTIRGVDEFIALLDGYYGRSRNFRSDVLRLVEQGEWVALQGHVVDGRIVEWHDYFDSRIVGKQLKAGRAAGT